MTIAEVIAEADRQRDYRDNTAIALLRAGIRNPLGWATATPDLPPDELAQHWRAEEERRQRSCPP